MLNVFWSAFSEQGMAWFLSAVPLNYSVRGVYILWKPGEDIFHPKAVIKVGQGDIADQLSHLKSDPEITKYGDSVKVTWAVVPETLLDGTERYLADNYHPLENESFPQAPPVAVNLPL